MLIYILKSTAILAVLLVFYKLFLEKENIHVFKRHFLLASILLAIGIPSITFTNYVEAQPIIEPLMLSVDDVEFEVVNEVAQTIDYTAIILWSLYGLGVLFFAIRFLVNLTKIGLRIKNNPKLKKNGVVNVLIPDLIIPHTFFSYIFFNKYAFEAKKIPNEVKIHEQTHAKQLHSLDIIIIELLQVVFWFNPLLYILKNYIKLNHEFLADDAVLKSGTELKKYQKTLLAYTNTHNHYPIANAINYSSIKKRFTIMKTKNSQKKAWLKSLLLLPLVSVLIYGFSTKETVISKQMIGQESQESKSIDIPEINVIDEATPKMMQEYNDFIKKYNSSKNKVINHTRLQRIIAIYNLMSENQKASVGKYPETKDVIGINLNKVNGKTPTQKEFNSWKNAKQFALWIDGKHINNKKLNNYKASDIVYFAGSKVHKNARSKKFPQPFQYSLFTKKGFEETYKKANYNNYIRLLEVYNQQLKKINQVDYSELQILKSRLDLLFKKFSSEELKKYKPKKATDLPLQVIQTKATPAQLKEYNKLATFYSSRPWSKTIVKLKDVKRMKTLRNLMSDEQKKSAKPFPNLPPPPKSPVIKIGVNDKDYNIPPPPISKKGDALKIYKAKNNYYEKLRNVKPHFIKRSEKKQNRMYELFSELGSLYFSLSKENKRRVTRPVFPHYPYVRLNKNGKNYYKLKNELTEEDKNNLPKPPPPPKNQKTGYKTINNEKLYYVENDGNRQYYDKYGNNVYVKEILSGPQKGETLAITELNETPVDEIEIVEEIQETMNNPTEIQEVIHEEVIEEVQEQEKAKKGWEYINDETYYYVIENGKKQYYNRWGRKVTFTNKEKTESVVVIDKAKPKNKLSFIKSKNKDFDYFINGKSASYQTVIALDKNSLNKIKVVRKKNKKPAIYITTK